jgi:glycosyltransferase involved in cell wall biosynthesis
MTINSSLSVLVFTRDLDRYSVYMLQELERMGHRVNVVIEPQSGAHARDWSADIAIVEQVKLNGRFDKQAAQRYAENVKKYAADVCLCYTSRALSVALTARRRHAFNVPIVGTRGAIGGVSAFYLQDWFTYLSPGLDAVACMSQAIANKVIQEARRLYPRHPGYFKAIYPGYGQLMETHEPPVARCRSADQRVRLLCVANDRPIKGLAVLLDAVENHVHSTNWQLDIVGQCGDEIRNRIHASEKLTSHVIAHGFRSDVPDFFRAAHIYIQPTLQPGEGIGNSMAEAMSFGLPVITSNVGGGIELTAHEQTGLHFQVGDSQALALSIQRLMDDPILCDVLGMAAADTLQTRFSLRQEASEFLALFNALIKKRHPQ